MLLLLVDIVVYLGLGLAIASFWWSLAPSVAVIFMLSAPAYLVYAWFNADRIVAAKAGFHEPTLVQGRYFEYLGIKSKILTHPSPLPAAGIFASNRSRAIIITSGAIQDLPEDDLRLLVKRLEQRDRRPVFRWTYHMATVGIRLFDTSELGHTTFSWGKAVMLSAVVMAVNVITTVLLFVTALAPYKANQTLPVEPALVPAGLLIGFSLLHVASRFINKGLTNLTFANWNKPIELSVATLWPVAKPGGFHANLRLLRKGLVWAKEPIKKPHAPGSELAELEKMVLESGAGNAADA